MSLSVIDYINMYVLFFYILVYHTGHFHRVVMNSGEVASHRPVECSFNDDKSLDGAFKSLFFIAPTQFSSLIIFCQKFHTKVNIQSHRAMLAVNFPRHSFKTSARCVPFADVHRSQPGEIQPKAKRKSKKKNKNVDIVMNEDILQRRCRFSDCWQMYAPLRHAMVQMNRNKAPLMASHRRSHLLFYYRW